jgi:hypothetical protein
MLIFAKKRTVDHGGGVGPIDHARKGFIAVNTAGTVGEWGIVRQADRQ